MFKNNFVVSLKVGGKVLREAKDIIELPFGSEYEIYLKNLNDTDAAVQISIDGKEVFPQKLLVKAHSSIDVKSNDQNFAFKFIEKTEKIAKHRGNKAEDGLITVSYQFVEKDKQSEFSKLLEAMEDIKKDVDRKLDGFPYRYHHHYWPYYYYPYGRYWDHGFYCGGAVGLIAGCHGSAMSSGSSWLMNAAQTQTMITNCVGSGASVVNNAGWSGNGDIEKSNFIQCSGDNMGGEIQMSYTSGPDMTFNAASGPKSDSGITVAGQEIEQDLAKFDSMLTSHMYTITLKLVGKLDEIAISKPVFTREKLECGTCGTHNGSDHKYCKDCGTNLAA